MKLKPKTFKIAQKTKGVQSRLIEMTPEEKFLRLEKILSDEDLEKWLQYNEIRQRFIDRWNAGEHTSFVKRHIEMGDRYTLPYEKQIFGDVDVIPDVNQDDFAIDIQEVYIKDRQYRPNVDETELEKRQIEAQSAIEYTFDEQEGVRWYGGWGSDNINGYLRQSADFFNTIKRITQGLVDSYAMGEKGVQKFIQDTIKHIESIQSAIEKSQGLLQDTTLYRGGIMDRNLKIGDVSSFEGFASSSYNKASAEAYTRETGNPNYRDNYMIIILAPKGTKGIAVNGIKENNSYAFEHEFLLNHGQRFVVLDINHEEQTATVLLVDDDYDTV